MNSKPFLLGVAIAFAGAALYFAYRAGQENYGEDFDRVVREELDRVRSDYDAVLERYDDDILALRSEFTERSRELEQEFYALREELARAGVEITPVGIRRSRPAEPQEEGVPAIDRQAFNQLRTNMSYADAERILGRPGELTFKIADGKGVLTENYRWSWVAVNGSNARISVSFEDGKLRNKEFRDDLD